MTEETFDLGRLVQGKEGDKLRARIRKQLRVTPGEPAGLAKRDPAWTGGPEFESLSEGGLRETAKAFLAYGVEELADAQEQMWADDRYALLAIFQGLDASGKDSTIKHVMSGVNPRGVEVYSFQAPSSEELDHDFLWRINRRLPERGRIGIFNRSHYEEVTTVRVHPQLLERQKLPPQPSGDALWKKRFDDINRFERHLDRSGTKVVKFFLHVSRKEQRKRLLARIDNPKKHWKFRLEDVTDRALWDDYISAYEDAITATSTEWAPWYVIPADRKPAMQAVVVGIILDTLRDLKLKWPKPTPEQRADLAKARALLEAETD